MELMQKKIDDIIEEVIRLEKGFVDDPQDSGGATNWGITEEVARDEGWHGPMEDLPRQFAKEIYYRRYVVNPGYASILPICPEVAAELVEFGVNCGPGRASLSLQEGLNDLNDGGKLYPDIREDGEAGKNTRGALKAFLDYRGQPGVIVLLRDINARQHHHYSALVRRRPKDERFFYGWVLNRVVI